MLRRAGIFLLVAFQFLWLNIVIPGHTRGMIVMAGVQSSSEAHSCCDMDDMPAPSGKQPATPSKDRAANCAICAFAAHLSVPPVIDLAPRPSDLLCRLPDPRVQSITAQELVLSYLGRAPPHA